MLIPSPLITLLLFSLMPTSPPKNSSFINCCFWRRIRTLKQCVQRATTPISDSSAQLREITLQEENAEYDKAISDYENKIQAKSQEADLLRSKLQVRHNSQLSRGDHYIQQQHTQGISTSQVWRSYSPRRPLPLPCGGREAVFESPSTQVGGDSFMIYKKFRTLSVY
ncbi:hypothetical protein P3L10_013542 [Capsicum annuum]